MRHQGSCEKRSPVMSWFGRDEATGPSCEDQLLIHRATGWGTKWWASKVHTQTHFGYSPLFTVRQWWKLVLSLNIDVYTGACWRLSLLCFKNITSVLLCGKHRHVLDQVAEAVFYSGSWTLLVNNWLKLNICVKNRKIWCVPYYTTVVFYDRVTTAWPDHTLNTTLYTPTQIVHNSRDASLNVLFYFFPHCLWLKNWFHLPPTAEIISQYFLPIKEKLNQPLHFIPSVRQRDGLHQNKYYTLRYT